MLAAGRAAAAAKSTLNPHAPKCAIHVASILVRRASSVQSWSPRLCGYAGWAAIRRSSALRHPLLQNGGGGRTRRVATTAGSGAVPQPVQGLSLVGRTVLFVPACITLCLGAWQVNRLEWKYGQIELRNQLLASRPSLVASGNELLERWDELMPQRGGTEFAPMTLRGRFEHDKEVYIGMRGKPGAVEEGLGAGYSVVTPFVVEGANSSAAPVRVLVNRGWVPANAKKQRSEEREQAEQAARPGDTTPPTVEDLQVVIRKGEKGASYGTTPTRAPHTRARKRRHTYWTAASAI
eukprot:COSAG02_NODE_832_length_16660_cov_16.228006_16_plen_293_part_00